MTGAADSSAPAIRTEPLFSMQLAVDPLVAPGGPAGASRRVGVIAGGSFEGPGLRGVVLPGGVDWQIVRSDGAILLDARIVLQTSDAALIAMTYTGLRHGPPEVMARLGRGEAVDPAAYYFRIVPSFSTDDPRYDWLNRIVAIGTGDRAARGPHYRIHRVI